MPVPFDPADPTYGPFVASLSDSVAGGGALKLVAVPEDWCPCFTAPGDDTPRALVRVAPFNLAGRGPSPHAGWSVRVEGADDTAMVLSLDGPGREADARTVFDLVGDGATMAALRGLGFTQE